MMLAVGVSTNPWKLGLTSAIWSALRVAVVNTLSSVSVLIERDGTNVRFVCDLAIDGRTRSTAKTSAMIGILTGISDRMAGSTGLDPLTVDVDTDAGLQQVDGDDEASLVRLLANEEAFESGQWSLDHAHAVALTEVRVRKERDAGVDETLDRVDLRIRNRRQPCPAAVEDPH